MPSQKKQIKHACNQIICDCHFTEQTNPRQTENDEN
jgi:hypothetical protein